MPFLAKLALRNLWRNKRRTALTFSALALGIAWLILVDSLTAGFNNASVQNVVNFETGEVQVHAPGYFDDREELPLDRPLPAEPVLDTVREVDGVKAATPRVVFGARLNVGWEELPVMGVAIDPARDGDVFALAGHVEGRLPEAGAREATVGAGLAEIMDVRVGDYITLITRTRNEALQALGLEVVGLVRTPHPTVNENHVYLPLDVADAALAMDGRVTEVVLRLEDGSSPEAAAGSVRTALAAAGVEAEVFTWRQAAADFLALSQAGAAGDFMIALMILVIALVGVTNTVLLGALERRQEIGTMKAMGMREGKIVRLFLLEATGIGLLAAFTGSALGAAVNLYLVEVGFDFAALLGDLDIGYPITGTVYGVWNEAIFLWAGVAGIVTCWIAGYLPARRAARKDPATTVRG